MRIGSVDLPSPFAIAPMAGMTDTAFRRLVKRQGGCGLVVTEMASIARSNTRSTRKKSGRFRFRFSAASRRRWPMPPGLSKA
jgi:tRNA-dihydrouridine synthase